MCVRGHREICGCWSSPSLWVLGIELRLSVLAESRVIWPADSQRSFCLLDEPAGHLNGGQDVRLLKHKTSESVGEEF